MLGTWLPEYSICQLLYSLESKTPVLLSKQGFGMGSSVQRGLNLEQPMKEYDLTCEEVLQSLEHLNHRISFSSNEFFFSVMGYLIN